MMLQRVSNDPERGIIQDPLLRFVRTQLKASLHSGEVVMVTSGQLSRLNVCIG